MAKKKSLRAAEQDRPDVPGKRRRWRGWQRFMDPARFIFLDETATAANMTRRYGRGRSDRRLVAAEAHGHWRTTTFIAGLRQTGICRTYSPDLNPIEPSSAASSTPTRPPNVPTTFATAAMGPH